MDKLGKYQQLAKTALSEYAALLSAPPQPQHEVTLAFDDEHRQYILREVGWDHKKWIHRTVLHVSIRNNKLWIDEDWTEDGIATFFIQHNVPKEDIVLGFQAPEMRPYSEFAVA